MLKRHSIRHFLLILAIACLALSMALYLQHADGQRPCPLCILQRYAFAMVALTALLGIVLPFKRSAHALIMVSALTGLAVAGRHLWVLAHPDSGCGLDPLQVFVNSLAPARWLPEVFYSNGVCSTPYPPLLGLHLAVWAALGFGVIMAFSAWGITRQKKVKTLF